MKPKIKSKKTSHVIIKKRRKKATDQRTGAPPAYFLLALHVENPLQYVIDGHRKERQSLSALSAMDIGEQTYFALTELAERVTQPPRMMPHAKLEDAADMLAAIATTAVSLLRQLASSTCHETKQNIIWTARSKNVWPVLLSLGKKRDKKGNRFLESADKAKDFLNSIGLGEQPTLGLTHLGDPTANKFKQAAELLLYNLVRWRERGAWRGELTSWSKDLLALEDQMTTTNVDQWWSVAKRWMDEQWKVNRGYFRPLTEALKLDDKKYTESLVKSRVIDDSLKKAFKALAATDIL